jgi:hypothetical protein
MFRNQTMYVWFTVHSYAKDGSEKEVLVFTYTRVNYNHNKFCFLTNANFYPVVHSAAIETFPFHYFSVNFNFYPDWISIKYNEFEIIE